jgi:voltage-gated sodium channel
MNRDAANPGAEPSSTIINIDRAFCFLYSIELVFRLLVHGLYFFWCPDMHWNILDFSLVTYSLADIGASVFSGSKTTSKTTWVRSLRLFRVAKVLRVLRVVKFLNQLQVIMNSIAGSIVSLFWSVAMLFIIFYMFSLMLVQSVTDFLAENPTAAVAEDLRLYYGSVQKCLWTLFATCFGADGWNMYFNPLAEAGWGAQVIFSVYILFLNVALMNILTGIFVERALEVAAGDQQAKAQKLHEKVMEDAHELIKMCQAHDPDSDNKMTPEDFQAMLQNEEFERFMHFVGLDVHNVQGFFEMISENEEDIDIATFVAGCMALRGEAKATDQLYIMLEVEKMKANQEDVKSELEKLVSAVQRSSK